MMIQDEFHDRKRLTPSSEHDLKPTSTEAICFSCLVCRSSQVVRLRLQVTGTVYSSLSGSASLLQCQNSPVAALTGEKESPRPAQIAALSCATLDMSRVALDQVIHLLSTPAIIG